ISSDGSSSFPVSSFSTSRLKSSFGSFRALCNQVAQSKCWPSSARMSNQGLGKLLLRPGWKRFDFGLPVFLSLRKIVIELHLQPKLGRRVRHRLGKPHAHH